MKKRKIFTLSVIVLLLTASILRIGYICTTIPDEIYITQNSKYNFDKSRIFSGLFSMTSPADNAGTLSRDGKINTNDSYTANVEFLNIPVKTVTVNLIDKHHLIPCGIPIGVRLYAGGVEILSSESFLDTNGNPVNPAKDFSFKKGDVITEVNGIPTKNIQEFSKQIAKNQTNTVTLSVKSEKGTYTAQITPHQEQNGKFRVGLIVRDSMAGIGTLTYINPNNNSFGALGHGIEDSDTNHIFPVNSGTVEEATVLSVTKGRKGSPGEIHGMFSGKAKIGNIYSNTHNGIFGNYEDLPPCPQNPLPVASISEINRGKAYVLSTINDEGVRSYNIEIEKILHMSTDSSKGMVIRITDNALLASTGGIVQGMSGSPIIQNGKLIGAVTHVFVNDPTRGYGIFIENMLSEAEKIKQ